SIPSSGTEFYMASAQEEALQESSACTAAYVTPNYPAAASNGTLASSGIIDLTEEDSPSKSLSQQNFSSNPQGASLYGRENHQDEPSSRSPQPGQPPLPQHTSSMSQHQLLHTQVSLSQQIDYIQPHTQGFTNHPPPS